MKHCNLDNSSDNNSLKSNNFSLDDMVISKRSDGSYIGSHLINFDNTAFSDKFKNKSIQNIFEDLAVPSGLAVVPGLYMPCKHDNTKSCSVIASDSNVELIKDNLITELLDIACHIDEEKLNAGKVPRKSRCKKNKNKRKTRKRYI